jgi:hypothetical protein
MVFDNQKRRGRAEHGLADDCPCCGAQVFELNPFADETECEKCGHVLDPRPSGKIDLRRDINEFLR